MDEFKMQEYIREALEGHVDLGDSVKRVETLEEAGILTRNAGLVIRMNNGSTFQITVVKSR